MKLMIHDLPEEEFKALFPAAPKDCTVIGDDGNIHQCIGCFGCLLKTPGECLLHDSFSHLAKTLSATDEMVLVSRCVYGSVSPFIKNALDRMLGYLKPVLETRENATGFKIRYPGRLHLSVHFYACPDEEVRGTARAYIDNVVKAFDITTASVQFHESAEELKEAIL